MPYSSVVKEFSTLPKIQTPGYHALQKLSSGPQAVAFVEAEEIWVRFLCPAKWTIATDGTEAAANFAGSTYNKVDSGYERTIYAEAGKSLFVLNDADSDLADGFETIKYQY